MSKKVYSIVVKREWDIDTRDGKVHFVEHVAKPINCYKVSDVTRGDPVRVVAGKKVPIGTEGIVKTVCINKYSSDVTHNPSVFITLPDGTEVKTVGHNLINLKNVGDKGCITEWSSFEDFCEGSKNNQEQIEPMWYIDKELNVKSTGLPNIEDYKMLNLDTLDKSYKSLLYNKKQDTYAVVEFAKTFTPGNVISFKQYGTASRFRDIFGGDDGRKEAELNYNMLS